MVRKQIAILVLKSFVSLYVPAVIMAGIGVKASEIPAVLPHTALGTMIRLPAFAVANYFIPVGWKRAIVSNLAVMATHLLVALGQVLNSGAFPSALIRQGPIPYLGTMAVALMIAVPAATILYVWDRRPKASTTEPEAPAV